MKKGLLVALLILAAITAGIVVLFVISARNAGVYPTTPEGWAARWEAAAAEFGRTPGEGWDVWLDVFAELDTATDPAQVAALTDRLRPIERFTMSVPAGVGTMAVFTDYTEGLGRIRRPLREVMLPALERSLLEGDFEQAADWVERSWALTRVAGASGTIIGGLVEFALVSSVHDALRPHLPTIAESGHARLLSVVQEIPKNDILWSLRMEREVGLHFIHAGMVDSFVMAKDQLRLFDEALVDWARFASAGDTEARERVIRLVDRLENDTIYSKRRLVLSIILPALDKATVNFRAGMAGYHATRVILALESYRITHGQYPDTLDALVPQYIDQLPPDPHRTTHPFVYRVVDENASDPSAAYLLYSIGADGVDNGGRWPDDWRANPLTSANASGDHLFNQPRPQPPPDPDEDPDQDPEDDPDDGLSEQP
jgi:hypothetical protein